MEWELPLYISAFSVARRYFLQDMSANVRLHKTYVRLREWMHLNVLPAVKLSGGMSVDQAEEFLRKWYLPQQGVFSEWLKNHPYKDSTAKPTSEPICDPTGEGSP